MELLEGKVLQSNENKCAYKPIKKFLFNSGKYGKGADLL